MLPHSEVAVLHGQFRPVRRTAGTAGRIGRCHVRCQGVHREPVGDDVVDDDHEYVPALVPVDAQDRAADRNFGRGVEACRGQLEDSIGHSGSSDDFRLQDRHDLVAGHHLLNRLSVDRGELRPQALVAPQYVRYRGLQCGEVQIAVEAHCQGNVVGGGRHVELVEEPHPLLCQRHGQWVRARSPSQRWSGVLSAADALRQTRELPNCRRLEQSSNADVGAEKCVDAGDDAGRGQ